MELPRRVIINADDFGLTESVNDAILEVYKAGNLTSTTLMVNMPGTVDAVSKSFDFPDLAIGLHFCITEGYPLTYCPSLIRDDGKFQSRSELIKKGYRKNIVSKELELEFLAQYTKALELGISVTHVDSHQHTLQIPFVFHCLRRILEEKQLKIRVVNPPNVRFGLSPRLWKRTLKNFINSRSSLKMKSVVNCVSNDVLVSVHDKHSDIEFSRSTYYDLLDECGSVGSIELMVHPYILGEDVLNMYSSEIDSKMTFLRKCEREYQLLCSESLFDSYSLIDFGMI